MRKNISTYYQYQVFLNHPFDDDFTPLADAMAFAVVAANLLPVSALDVTTPDKLRLQTLVEMIRGCNYSVHDLSRCRGEGPKNYARMNMPIEMGMALFHAFNTQYDAHRCAFLVKKPHEFNAFASDLSGFDPGSHDGKPENVVSYVYDWLRSVVRDPLASPQPTVHIVEKFKECRKAFTQVNGSGPRGKPNHSERREIMYQACAASNWWDWRLTRPGRNDFPETPLAWKGAKPA